MLMLTHLQAELNIMKQRGRMQTFTSQGPRQHSNLMNSQTFLTLHHPTANKNPRLSITALLTNLLLKDNLCKSIRGKLNMLIFV